MIPKLHVASRPAAPLMIYDGDCNFCKFWILRWQAATMGRVEFIASQEPRVAGEFPELPREIFAKSVQLIETNGTVYDGAEAVFRALGYHRWLGWPLWAYRNFPGVQPVTEFAYHFVARHREGFSLLTRILWGRAGAIPSYDWTAWIFLRFMGLIYLSAFLSLGSQIIGLVGHDGILPAKEFMQAARTHFDQEGIGLERYHLLPTLCWVNASDGFLRLLCGAGVGLSLLVAANVAPAISLFCLWAIYLSLMGVCREFLGFQWDALLLETGFLAIFLAPPQFFPRAATPPRPSRAILWLLRWLLFRLMFESGLVKLLSGDESWRNGTALNFHYYTQPLPSWVAWYAQQWPARFQKASVEVMFFIELAVPFLIFAPRRPRFIGCALLIFLQVFIFVTGNYCFFNLLTIAMCWLLLDDAAMEKLIPRRLRERFRSHRLGTVSGADPRVDAALSRESTDPSLTPTLSKTRLSSLSAPSPQPSPPFRAGEREKRGVRWPGWVLAPVAAAVLLVSLTQLLVMTRAVESWPEILGGPLGMLEGAIRPFNSVNTYGLFAVMTTSRLEIVIEGSDDGKTWLPYEFKYKPGDPMRRPQFVAPHQPRLDWQMWFAALGDYERNPWLVNFCVRLLQGSPDVLALLARNPFPGAPPRFIRAQAYDYHFSTPEERRAQGVWWRRELKGEYLPEISLRK